MNAHNLSERHGEHAIRIVNAQIFFRGKRKLSQIGQRTYIFGNDARIVKYFTVMSNILVNPVDYGLKSFQLQLFKLIA